MTLVPLKKEILAGVTVLTLGSGKSTFLMEVPLFKAGFLSIIAILNCFVNGMDAAPDNHKLTVKIKTKLECSQ